jgi:crotonobetainyl-CoA:carnitine CoA-transferase CaiB-like acyl-CoA transferase
VARYDELALDLAEAFAQNARDHWLDLLEQNDVPFAPERRLEELVDDPQVQHLDVFYDMVHSQYGSVRAAHRPVRYDGDNHSNFMPPPALGEHTREVLVAAGLDADDLEKLAKEGAI